MRSGAGLISGKEGESHSSPALLNQADGELSQPVRGNDRKRDAKGLSVYPRQRG
jgi:hypothetical protein